VSELTLQTIGLRKSFAMVRAADGLDIKVPRGQIVGIVGPNGSGKTTLLNLVTGYVAPDAGHIRYRGREITGLHPRDITRLGIARSFQVPQLHLSLTVLDSMLLALAVRERREGDAWGRLARGAAADEARALLTQFGFAANTSARAATLPEGGRKLLDVALSFALRPTLFLLDEPTSGVSAADKFGVMDTLLSVIRAGGVTTVFVEHDMDVVQRYADRVLVFNEGKVIADDPPDQLFLDPAIRRHVLGEE
jgi:branched-chain amino acid transport system ATP-binding protein